jgi:3-methyladenine DNA glycosylase AlkD
MKSELRFHGVTAAQVRATAAAFCASDDLDVPSLRGVVDELFATDWFDLRSVGIALLERRWRVLSGADLPWLIDLARIGACWAHVDYLVTKIIDPVVAREPALLERSRRWAKDPDFWVRRVALLAQLRALRSGGGDFPLFAAIAEPMLDEKEFFIQKAIGWVLREVSKKRASLVRDFLRAHGERASAVTWREATKYLPPAMLRDLPARAPRSRRARST